MNDNIFSTNPIKVHVVNPLIGPDPIKSYVLLAQNPSKIREAVRAKNNSLLSEIFGRAWKEKLLIGPAAKKTGGGPEDMGDEFDITVESLAEPLPKTAPVNPPRAEKAPGQTYVVTEEAGIADVLGIKVDDADITPDFSGPIVEYVGSPQIFPEDKIREVKEKIFLITKIPPYRQHLFWYEGDEMVQPYKFYTDRTVEISVFNIQRDKSSDELVLNKEIYNNRAEIRIEAFDEFKLAGGINTNDIYVVDLAEIIKKERQYMQEKILQDQYQFELYYFGLIVLYWPQLTQECFRALLLNEKILFLKYPALAPIPKNIEARFESESGIINEVYKKSYRVESSLKKIRANFAITHMIATPRAPTTIVNVRNLFDKLHVSRCIPEIHFHTKIGQLKYLFQKIHIKSESPISFPGMFNSGVTLAISLRKADQDNYHYRPVPLKPEQEQSRYIFLNILVNGHYFVKSIWNEEDGKDFTGILTIMKKFVDPIINKINSFGREILPEGGKLPLLSAENVSYQTINASIFWKKLLSESQFKILRALLTPYIESGIISARGTINDFTFKKGMHNFDQSAIYRNTRGYLAELLKNQYSYLSNNDISQRWNQFYYGRAVRISHRTTDVAISVLGITEYEFNIFFKYIAHFIASVMCDPSFQEAAIKKMSSGPPAKKIKKLKQFDPELYNLKKYGSKKTYSIKCQNPKQPMVYTEEEIQTMSPEMKKKLYRYWNFTLNREAFYSCPSKNFPNLFFMVGVHPKGYCMPCCKKSGDIEGSVKAQINKLCLDNHSYDPNSIKTKSVKHRHIVNYGRELDVGRAARLPTALAPIFGQASGQATDEEGTVLFILYGVPQSLPGLLNIGPIYSIVNILGITITEFAKEVISAFTNHPNLFFTVMHGQLIEYFGYVEDLVGIIRELFVEEKLVSGTAIRKLLLNRKSYIIWNGLFIEMAHILYNLSTISILDQTNETQEVETGPNSFVIRFEVNMANIDITNETHDVCVLVWKGPLCYPVYLVDTSNYFVNHKPLKKVFNKNDKFMQKILKTFRTKYTTKISEINIYLLTEFIKAQNTKTGPRYFIIEKFINRRGYCYGATIGFGTPDIQSKFGKSIKIKGQSSQESGQEKLDSPPKLFYIALDPTDYIADDIPITFEPVNIKTRALLLEELAEFVQKYNKYTIGQKDRYQAQIKFNARIKNLKTGKYEALVGKNGITVIEPVDGPELEKLFGKLQEQITGHELYLINKTIMSRCKPDFSDNRVVKTSQALYHNQLYHLFLSEIVLFIHKNGRNEKLRAKILETISAANKESLYKDPYEIIGHFDINQEDKDELAKMVRKPDFKKLFNAKKWGFDFYIIYDFKDMPEETLRKTLTEYANNCVVESDQSKIDNLLVENKFPNIYTPCGDEQSQVNTPYCINRKLIVPEGTITKFIDILIYDIRNELKQKYIFENILTDNVLNMMDFEEIPYEKIIIVGRPSRV